MMELRSSSLKRRSEENLQFSEKIKAGKRRTISNSTPQVIKLREEVLSNQVQAAKKCLTSGQVIAVPTDTIYGLVGLAQNTQAVHKIYEIKERNTTKPIAICVGDVEDVYKWGKVTISKDLLSELLPGPVTLVFESTEDLNQELNPGTNLVGIRIPDHKFIQSLAQECREPLALTSANISASQSTLKVQEFKHLWPQLGLVCDGGVLGDTEESRLGSTVVNLSKPGKYQIIRNGSAYKSTVNLLSKYGLQEENS